MRVTAFFTLLVILTGLSAKAQDEKVLRGWVADSISKTPVENCTITLLLKEGKTLKATTNEEGRFVIKTKADTILVTLQAVGYAEQKFTRYQVKSVPDSFYLRPVDKLLDAIVIKAKLPPVVIRGDTTEFNIDSSMFDSYDVVEDLVKRLPGLEIDEFGKMSFQGKPITRILVDGEDLFGGDPNFSIKKLPAGLVAKIQVMDTRTLEQLFNNEPATGDDKTLNIRLKSGNKLFGGADALAGTKNQLQANASLSSFEEKKRIAILGSFNSSNKIGFTKLQIGPATSSTNTSINYGNRWGALNLNGSYGYTASGNSNETYLERTQVITADTSFFIRNSNRSNYESDGHRVNATANWMIDSVSNLDVDVSMNATANSNRYNSSTITTENGALRNKSFTESNSTGHFKNMSAGLSFTRQFAKRGRRLLVSGRMSLAAQQTNLFNQSTNTYFKFNVPVSGDTLNRNTKTDNTNKAYNIGLSYVEPISKNLSVTLRSDFDFSETETIRAIYNLDSVAHSAVYDSVYSAEIKSANNTQNLNASLVYNAKKWNLTSGLTTTTQQTVRTLQKETIQQNLFRYSPSLTAMYILSPAKQIRANFSATTIQPTIEQLQPVPDNSNPLYIRLGNPALRTAFSQNYGFSYNYNSLKNSVSAGLAYTPVSNQIVNAIYYDEFRKQTSRFINVDGVYSLRGNFAISTSARQDKKSQTWSFSSSGSYGQQVFFQSNNQYYSRNYVTQGSIGFNRREQVLKPTSYGIGVSASFNRNWTPANRQILNTTRLNIAPRVDASYTLLDFLYATVSYQLWYNQLDYHSEQRRNDEYSIHKVDNILSFQPGKKYNIQTSFSYYYTTQVPAGTRKDMPALNVVASAFLLRGRGLVKFSAMNLFSPNNDFRRQVGDNYIEDVRTVTLRNLFTLRLQYNFSRIEKKPPTAVTSSIK